MIALVFLWHWKRARDGWQRGARAHRMLTKQQAILILDLAREIERHTEFARSVAATEASAMAQWVTEVISKQMRSGIKPTSEDTP